MKTYVCVHVHTGSPPAHYSHGLDARAWDRPEGTSRSGSCTVFAEVASSPAHRMIVSSWRTPRCNPLQRYTHAFSWRPPFPRWWVVQRLSPTAFAVQLGQGMSVMTPDRLTLQRNAPVLARCCCLGALNLQFSTGKRINNKLYDIPINFEPHTFKTCASSSLSWNSMPVIGWTSGTYMYVRKGTPALSYSETWWEYSSWATMDLSLSSYVSSSLSI